MAQSGVKVCALVTLHILTACATIAPIRAEPNQNETTEVGDEPMDYPMHNDESVPSDERSLSTCMDWQHNQVRDGEVYIPNAIDMCMQCTCDKGFPIMCHAVACSPPLQCANPQLVEGACCEYICLDDGGTNERNKTNVDNDDPEAEGESITNLSLRLIASTVTSFLVLALLLFMVHRLRQRRLLLAMRRFEARANQGPVDDTDSEVYIPDAFLSLECPPYTDPPPPYSPPKPPQILPGEQPPPYSEINTDGQPATGTPDENRNDVNGRPPAGTAGQGGRGAVMLRSPVEMDRTVSQSTERSTENGRSRAEDVTRPPNILPAYASTDVVEGLGVVISPGSDQVAYTSGWPVWQEGNSVRGLEPETRCIRQELSGRGARDVIQNPGHVATCRAQTTPSTTAFQRFSSLFKPDSWRNKHRHRGVGRPLSECSVPPHYATVPRHDSNAGSFPGNDQPRRDCGNIGEDSYANRYARWFPGRMCASYDSSQGVYTLADVSPSTSSSNSSPGCEPHETYNINTANTGTSRASATASTASTVLASSSPTSNSSPTSPGGTAEDSPTTHRQHHHNTIQRIPQDFHGGLHNAETNDTISDRQAPFGGSAVSQSLKRERNAFSTLNNQTQSRKRCGPQTSSFRSSSQSPHGQQSLGAFIRAHPMAMLSGRGLNTDPLSGQPTTPLSATAKDNNLDHSAVTSHTSGPGNALPSNIQENPCISVTTTHPLSDTTASHGPAVTCPVIHTPEHNETASPPSPSPSPPVTATGGALRRSQSGTSQVSIFSVCSETGEKKLKAGNKDDIISADSQYPDHPSLTRAKHHHYPSISAEARISPLAVEPTRPVAHEEGVSDSSGHHNVQALVNKIEGSNHNMTSPVTAVYENSSVPLPHVQPHRPNDRADCNLLVHGAYSVAHAASSLCGETDPNLNTLPTMKAAPTKELPWEPCQNMSQSVNIPPLPPFAGPPSSRPGMSHTLTSGSTVCPDNTEAMSGPQPSKPGEVTKRTKKKRSKDRCFSSPQFSQLSKGRHGQGSPRRRLHAMPGEQVKDGSNNSKAEIDGKEDGIGKWPRSADARHRIQLGTMRSVLPSSSPGIQSLMRGNADVPVLYGNADVYHGGVCEPINGNVVLFDHPLSGTPWHGDEYLADPVPETMTVMNNLNQPPSLKTQPSHGPGISEVTVPVRPDINSQGKRKGGYKRQSSTGEKLGQGTSPVRHKMRPKSLTTTNGHDQLAHPGHVMPPWESMPRPSATQVETATGRGARSGFGHDLNFDDHSGQADHHTQNLDSVQRKVLVNSEIPSNVGNNKKLSRVDGPPESVVNRIGMWSGSGGNHPSTRSGLSNELSFTSRPAMTMGHTKKRQSVPGTGPHERGTHFLQHRGEKSAHPIERRMDRSGDVCLETTSYV